MKIFDVTEVEECDMPIRLRSYEDWNHILIKKEDLSRLIRALEALAEEGGPVTILGRPGKPIILDVTE